MSLMPFSHHCAQMPIPITDFLNAGALMSLSSQELLLGWGEITPAFSAIHPNVPVFYFNDFLLSNPCPWIYFSNWAKVSRQELLVQLGAPTPYPPCEWEIDSEIDFIQIFSDLMQQLKTDRLQKAVPYLFTRTSAHMTPKRLRFHLQRGLLALEGEANSLYGYWNASKGLLGLTPEHLFSHLQHEPKCVRTVALAGTSHRDQLRESFIKNEKELHEHALVVRGISQALAPLGKLQIGRLQVLQLPVLSHLMTPIIVELKETFKFDVLVECLHPTPALGAYPCQEGKEWVKAFHSQYPGGHYGAPVGFIDPHLGLSRCLVGIRNVQWDPSGMRMGAGCGIVKESFLENEWREILLKIQAIKKVFAL